MIQGVPDFHHVTVSVPPDAREYVDLSATAVVKDLRYVGFVDGVVTSHLVLVVFDEAFKPLLEG